MSAAETSSHNRQIASSTLWQIGSQAAMAFLSILASKFVAIGLEKELVGYYNSAYGFLQIFAILADFGLYAVAVREVSKAKDPSKTLGALMVLRGTIVVLSLGAAIAVAWLLPLWRGTPFPIGVTIAAFVPFFTLLAGMLRTVFQVRYRMHFVFVAEVLQRVLTTVGIGLFIVLGYRLSNDVHIYEWFLGIGGAGAFLLFVISFFYARTLMRIRLCFDRDLLKKMLFLAAPYGIAYLFMTMYRQLDVVFISLLRPDFALQNAYYGFAGRVEDMAFIIPTFLLNSTLPILTKRLELREDVRGLLGKTMLILLFFGSIFFLFSFVWARPFTLLFATPHYVSTAAQPGSDAAFRLMSVPMFLNGLILYSFYVFLAEHAWKRVALSFGLGVILTIVLNMLWTGQYGFVGAGAATVVVHIFLTTVLLPQTLRHHPLHLEMGDLLKWLVFSSILGAILVVTEPYLTSALRTFVAGTLLIPVIGGLAWMLGIQRRLLGNA